MGTRTVADHRADAGSGLEPEHRRSPRSEASERTAIVHAARSVVCAGVTRNPNAARWVGTHVATPRAEGAAARRRGRAASAFRLDAPRRAIRTGRRRRGAACARWVHDGTDHGSGAVDVHRAGGVAWYAGRLAVSSRPRRARG